VEYYTNILNVIGDTPMLELMHMGGGQIFAKAEFLNPGGSIKDRVARYIIKQAEERGELTPDRSIIEATSGNTGIGVTLVGIHKGYDVTIVMPEDMSSERKKIIRALGAELVSVPASAGIAGAVDKAKEMVEEDPSLWMVSQFTNPDNLELHYLNTGPEIWRQMEGEVDAFVAGVGSGGTLAGVGKFLKERNRDIILVAVEPANSAALLGHEPGLHKIQGIGDGFVPDILDPDKIDRVIAGRARQKDLDDCESWGALMRGASRCGLGTTAAKPILTTMRKFPELYRAKLRESECTLLASFDLDDAVSGYDDIARAVKAEASS